MTVVDTFATSSPTPRTRETLVSEDDFPGASELENLVLRAVADDPFASIRELARTVRQHPRAPAVSWWRVFRVLRDRRLITRKARVRLALGRHR